LNLVNLTDVYLKTGQTARAAHALTEAESINAELGDFQLTGTIACNQGDLARASSDFAGAARHYRRALECFRASGNMHDVVLALIGLGVTLHHLGQPAKAARTLHEAETLTISTGNSNRLPEVRAALAEIGQSAQARPPDGLTRRQAEILGYVANGMTTKAIAETLVLSTGTVDRHIATVYSKLGLANRAQATAYALRHGLIPPAGHLHIFLDSPPPPRDHTGHGRQAARRHRGGLGPALARRRKLCRLPSRPPGSPCCWWHPSVSPAAGCSCCGW
jgi:DNA-binding CsgD family transcriptional regulator